MGLGRSRVMLREARESARGLAGRLGKARPDQGCVSGNGRRPRATCTSCEMSRGRVRKPEGRAEGRRQGGALVHAVGASRACPSSGSMPVREIEQSDIRDTLAPIWHEKADTARKAMNRLASASPRRGAGPRVDLAGTGEGDALLGKQRHKGQNSRLCRGRTCRRSTRAYGRHCHGAGAAPSHPDWRTVRPSALIHITRSRATSGRSRRGHEGPQGCHRRLPGPLDGGEAVIAEARKFARDGSLFPGSARASSPT